MDPEKNPAGRKAGATTRLASSGHGGGRPTLEEKLEVLAASYDDVDIQTTTEGQYRCGCWQWEPRNGTHVRTVMVHSIADTISGSVDNIIKSLGLA